MEVLLELTCCLLEFVDFAAIITEIVAWNRSKPNRQARKIAKTAGTDPPPRDTWFQILVFLTPIVITLTGIIIYKYVRWLLG